MNAINVNELKKAIENNNTGMKTPYANTVKEYHVEAAKHHVAKLGFELSEVNINHFIYWMIDAELQWVSYQRGLMTHEQLSKRIAAQQEKYQAPFFTKANKIGAAAYLLTIAVNLQEQNETIS